MKIILQNTSEVCLWSVLQATEKWDAKVKFPILLIMPEAYKEKFEKLKALLKQLFQSV